MLGFCWKNHQRFCPRCRSRKLYALAEGKRRCARCSYTFHDFSGRFLNTGRLTPSQWLRIIKLFELETPAGLMAEQAGLAYNTCLKAAFTLRRAIAFHSMDGETLHRTLPGLIREGRIPVDDLARIPVFGIIEHSGLAFVDILPHASPEDVLHFKASFRLRTASLGKVVYTAPYRRYETLVFSGLEAGRTGPVPHNDRAIPIDSTKGFWAFAKERLRRFKGVDPARFPLYLKEFEFRYNNRKQDIFPLLAAQICALVPDLAQ